MKSMVSTKLYSEICFILEEAKASAARAINFEMVKAYWVIGKMIVMEEQKGKKRANYGEGLMNDLSKRLKNDYGRGFSVSNIKNMRQFYLFFVKFQTVSEKLSWSHYQLLTKVENSKSRQFYLNEAVAASWSVRELERQISSLLFERLALSKNKAGVLKLAKKGHEVLHPSDLVKDPYVLEFLGLKQESLLYEKKLESALIEHLQDFLLELGKGFSFVGRQQRLTIDGDHFYVDLVFYNRIARCFVLIDLKLGKLTHQDLGQMQMYLNYYKRTQKIEGENDPIGILLCSDKNDTVVKITLPENQNEIFASKYKLTLPTEKELVTEIKKERKLLDNFAIKKS
jgi:predicted nuclease of restriction endonuclease-like (RecB) superfamily